VKNLNRRFERVPVAEVLKKAIEIHDNRPVERLAEKTEPYTVPVKDVAGQN
jgi:hypothetical protein